MPIDREALKKELVDINRKLDDITNTHRCFFFKPYKWHERTLQVIPNKNITACIASNKIGKTCLGANTVISWALGFEPWSPVDKNYPDAVEYQGKYYKPSSLGKSPPVKIRIVGLDWKEHIGETIVPELKKWAPIGTYTTRKNEQGVEHEWDWFNKSEFKIMCNSQDDMVFESFLCDAAWLDEPLEKRKFTGISRGVFMVNGKVLFTMTPLSAAWVLDEIVLSGRGDIGIIDKLDIRANEHTNNDEFDKLGKMGISATQIEKYFDLLLYEDKEKGKYVQDKGKKAEEFIKRLIPVEKYEDIYKLKMLRFIKDIDPKEVAPRIFGEFKALIGKVLKEFDSGIHVIDKIEPDKIPTDWLVTPMIDWHLNVPIAVSYWAVDEHDINYCISETWENMSGEETADDIIRKKKIYGWNIVEVFIDPLAKGDTEYMKNRAGTNITDTYSIIQSRLLNHGIRLSVASKDKVSGIKNIETKLLGTNKRPSVFICKNCYRHLFEVNRWIYGDDGKPCKENDHFMENWYRYTLTGAKYYKKKLYRYKDIENTQMVNMV